MTPPRRRPGPIRPSRERRISGRRGGALFDRSSAWNEDRQLDVGVAGELEGHLLVAQKPIGRMVEGALAALAAQNAVLLPHLREFRAQLAQLLDQGAQRAILEVRGAMRAKLRDDAAGAAIPIADQRVCGRFETDEAQEISMGVMPPRPVEPAGEEPLGGVVP